MIEQQIELLAEIQRLALSCRDQTGAHAGHHVDYFPGGDTWSEVRILGDGNKAIFDSVVGVWEGGREERVISTHIPNTLLQQRDALASWIAENRKEKAA